MFIWTSPIPGEIASGHEARLGLLNGFTSFWGMRESLPKYLGLVDPNIRFRPSIYYLAMGSGGDLAHYMREHSWLPYHMVTRQPWEQDKYDYMCRNGDIRHDLGTGPSWSAGYSFCHICAKEDLDVSGYSYWRRIHQFPGIDMCSRHKKGLLTIRFDHSRYSLPHQHLQDATPYDAELIASITDHPVVSRYEEIATGLLRRDGPIAVETAEEVLRSRCRELGLTNGGVIWHMALRNRILRLAPSAWLATHFTGYHPGIDIDEGSHRWRIRDPDWAPSSAMEYAIALAVLFYSAVEALGRFADQESA